MQVILSRDPEICGTSLQGHIKASYGELVQAFGHPTIGDEYKVCFEWDLQFADGTVATIYDWKMANTYEPEGMTPAQIIHENRDWNVGGFNRNALYSVQDHLKAARESEQKSSYFPGVTACKRVEVQS